MKNRNAYISRTFVYLQIDAIGVNIETKEVKTYTVKVKSGFRTNTAKEKAVQNALPEGVKLVAITSETPIEELRGMLITDFLEQSIPLDFSKNDEIGGEQ